jgi:hypothetical protein
VGSTLLAGAAQAAPAAPPPAARASAAAAADGRCILVMNVIARDPKNRDAASRGTFYYLGRVAGRGQIGQLDAILIASSKGLNNQAALQAELKRCGAELNASGTRLAAAFQEVQQMSQAQAPAPAAPGAPAPLFPSAPAPAVPPPK